MCDIILVLTILDIMNIIRGTVSNTNNGCNSVPERFNLFDNLLDAIISGIIVSALFEIIKYGSINIYNRISEKSLPFAVGGHWGAHHSQGRFSAFEFMILKQQGVRLKFRLYQKTNDNRFHFYRGVGYIRGNKISLAYHEAKNSRSSSTGTYNLLICNVSEHQIELVGVYTEYSGSEEKAFSHPYCLRPLIFPLYECILISLFRSLYIKKLMSDKGFENVLS